MADGSRGSNALGWAVLGFLAGVAATLGVLVFLNPGHGRHHDEAPAETAIPAPLPKLAESEPAKPAPSAKPLAPVSTAAAAPSSTATVDQQVQEDAAAAGMTSRRQQSADAPPN
ncbi:MAG TPA: hypothetical protein VHY32_11430 [Caulobacteraceae bacterium]|jgi:hypothetical protein|nr:hypothetical protein [Caulobacteraceae bacterium]